MSFEEIQAYQSSSRNQSCQPLLFFKINLMQSILVGYFLCSAYRLLSQQTSIPTSSSLQWSVRVGDLWNGKSSPSGQLPPNRVDCSVIKEGYDKARLQSLPIRAPEAWRGVAWIVGILPIYDHLVLQFVKSPPFMLFPSQKSWCIGYCWIAGDLGRKTNA